MRCHSNIQQSSANFEIKFYLGLKYWKHCFIYLHSCESRILLIPGKVLLLFLTKMIFGSNESIRALKCEQSVLSRADGSVILSQGVLIKIFLVIQLFQWHLFISEIGNTVVMASVYGPLEAKIQKELSDRMYIDLNFKPKTGMPGKNVTWCLQINS